MAKLASLKVNLAQIPSAVIAFQRACPLDPEQRGRRISYDRSSLPTSDRSTIIIAA